MIKSLVISSVVVFIQTFRKCLEKLPGIYDETRKPTTIQPQCRLQTFAVLTMMTDTPAAVPLGLGSVLKCVFSLPDTSVFMLFSKSASS